jgi:Leucine-rich repeat (LRR) protein
MKSFLHKQVIIQIMYFFPSFFSINYGRVFSLENSFVIEQSHRNHMNDNYSSFRLMEKELQKRDIIKDIKNIIGNKDICFIGFNQHTSAFKIHFLSLMASSAAFWIENSKIILGELKNTYEVEIGDTPVFCENEQVNIDILVGSRLKTSLTFSCPVIALNMKASFLTTTSFLAYESLSQLVYLDISENLLSDITRFSLCQLKILIITGNKYCLSIKELENCHLPTIEEIDLSRSQIKYVYLPISKNHGLRKLNISYNLIEKLDINRNLCEHMEELNLESNYIDNMNIFSDNTWPQLKLLNLSFNRFMKIENKLLTPVLRDLKIASCSIYNQIENFNFLKESESNLISIQIERHFLKNFQDFLPKNTNQLKELYLDFNRIEKITCFDLKRLYAIELLYLSYNNLTSFYIFSNVHLPLLKKLHLSHNTINILAHSEVENLNLLMANLTDLDISNNPIHEDRHSMVKIFSQLPKLEDNRPLKEVGKFFEFYLTLKEKEI